jgi:hypothetical protein
VTRVARDPSHRFLDDALHRRGFSIWERRGGGGRNVTFPARQYVVNGDRRTFALLRPIADVESQNRVGELVLQAFDEYDERSALASNS